MLYTDNRQQLIITNVVRDCKVDHEGDFAIITAQAEENANGRTGVKVSIHRDALMELVGELCRPYIEEDLVAQAQRGVHYRLVKISNGVPERLMRDLFGDLAS